LAEETLRYRPERRRIVLVIHDGEPVYVGGLGYDMALSLQRLRQLERQGLTPIGLYLGQDFNPALEELFPRLVISGGGSLPEKLGNMIRSLV
jgi:nitric oxide reductase activation protein